MSHDIQAAWAATELARSFEETAPDYIIDPPDPGHMSAYAARESSRDWPYADGVVYLNIDGEQLSVAMEFKRPEEGPHGILTALGQGLAYMHKGHNSAAIVVPEVYTSHQSPGTYLKEVLDLVGDALPIGVFTYEEPDPTEVSPFFGKIACARKLGLGQGTRALRTTRGAKTQWAHIREGSSYPGSFFKYLQVARTPMGSMHEPEISSPVELVAAVDRISPGADASKFLSNSVSNVFHDRVWRRFWFDNVLHPEARSIWSAGPGPYLVNEEPSRLVMWNGRPSKFWSSRADSVKTRIVQQLNAGEIGEPEGWEKFALKVRERAHSFREDIDSGLEHMGFLDSDGRLTDLGHRFVDACERAGHAYSSLAMSLFRAALIQKGQYGALLHYIHRLSESQFRDDPLAFTVDRSGGSGHTQLAFDREKYRAWIASMLATELRVMRKVSDRGGADRGTARRPLQAELAVLGHLGLIPQGPKRFRLATGLVVDWPAVQQAATLSL